MAAKEVDLANAIRDAIKDASLSIAFVSVANTVALPDDNTVVRTYIPEYKLRDLDKRRLSIVPPETARIQIARGVSRNNFGIDVVLDHRPANDAEADADLLLIEELKDLFEDNVGTLHAGQRFVSFAPQDPIYPIAEEHSQGRLRCAFRMQFSSFQEAAA